MADTTKAIPKEEITMKRTLLLAGCLFFLGSPQAVVEPQVAAVTHHPSVETVKSDYVTRSCPDGYEGHLVVEATGLDGLAVDSGESRFMYDLTVEQGSGPYLAVCFPKTMMDKLRKNKDAELWIYPPKPI